ncbi:MULTISPECIES: hypothetical protein [unclassified Pseudomonas]|jgi:hypothetical protein|uniref:hypothetical protein n=1 Tax=unclassified Pseudomonas TaxID=196821 RepID=UPI002109C52E|nr:MULTISPECIES: hypothetical protein [unclassified Pseudomonas]MCQ6260214.1 hypothetical protein [Pseudomonas sp. Q11]MDD2029995.1 hypothetical protein [Pseudomonas sp. 39167]MEA1030137.1 hypothetical protein [Pseudomonas sp. N-137]
MTDKQIYELTIDDLASFGVWYFPMDESAEDELTVRPLLDKETCTDAQIIVRASFVGKNGSSYLGYLYWDGGGEVEYLKPVILLEDGSFVTFWNGMIEPSWADYSARAQELRSGLPFSYISESLLELPKISGRLEGLYYLDGDHISWVS